MFRPCLNPTQSPNAVTLTLGLSKLQIHDHAREFYTVGECTHNADEISHIMSDESGHEHLIVLARLPEPGRSKTRLIPAIGADKAAAVYDYLARRTLQVVRELSERRRITVTVHYTGGSDAELQAAFGKDLEYQSQQGNSLGERLQFAIEMAFARNAQRVLVIGTDCPTLNAEDLELAFDVLGNHEVVIGPALDGGYYLIGLTDSCPDLFDEIDWSTDQVYRQTIERALALKLTWISLRSLQDVDFPEDLLPLRKLPGADPLPCKTKSGRLSIVVPALNEEENLSWALSSIGNPHDRLEIIVVDGGSSDGTISIAQRHGCKVFPANRGRARQMNAGAAIATGEYILFLHADTILPNNYRLEIDRILNTPVQCGAFPLQIDSQGFGMRLIEVGVAIRSKFMRMPYGDQALFFRAADFYAHGGFKHMAIMEDYELITRMRRSGRIGIAERPVTTSARRWLKKGILRTTLVNQICVIAYRLGFSDKTIAWLYHGSKKSRIQ